MKPPFHHPDNQGGWADLLEQASAWLARRDRGLTADEQDAFFHWLHADPRHRQALATLQKAWLTLDGLVEWQPSHSAQPNPDLLAPPKRRRLGVWAVTALAAGICAAAALVFLLRALAPTPLPSPGPAESIAGVRVIPGPEREVLPDGSIATLKDGGRYELAFTPSERRLRLTEGELYVDVAKNPERPFVVETGGVTVRAIGTAFNVRRMSGALEVLVTEGRVRIETNEAGVESPAAEVAPGERARLDLGVSAPRPAIVALSPAEIARELEWQSVRLQFDELPLAAVAHEFNLRNVQQLRVADPAIGRLRISGAFRADQVDGFVRLLEASYGLKAVRDPDGAWVLQRVSEYR